MKVLLREDVDNLGYAGEVMTVADGYGRNYLIPRGIAVKASPNVLRAAEKWRERAAVRMSELQKEHEALSLRLVETHLTFIARAGETGKLYGSVTTADVVEKLNEELGTEIERRQIISGPLRQLGDLKITVRLSRDYQPQITVTIEQFEEEIPEEEEALEAAVEEAEIVDAYGFDDDEESEDEASEDETAEDESSEDEPEALEPETEEPETVEAEVEAEAADEEND
jgi:large subunit ribosomal protein L9